MRYGQSYRAYNQEKVEDCVENFVQSGLEKDVFRYCYKLYFGKR